MRADWDEFRAAARTFAVPSQNMVYADRDGHIGYQAPGRIPIRKPGNRGNYPARGLATRPTTGPGTTCPSRRSRRVLDPEEGFIVTANQASVDPAYPYYLGDSWDYGYRSQRIADVLSKKGTLSVADMSELQLDTRNGLAPRLVPYLLDVDAGSHYYAAGQRLLEDWDFTPAAPTSAAAAYFNVVWRNLLVLTFHDQLPERRGRDGGRAGGWWSAACCASPTTAGGTT